jgi:hypothetical protein
MAGRSGHGLVALLAGAVLPAMAAVAARPAPVRGAARPEPVQFNRDIRPILSDNCFACHGPDKNKRVAGFRLDLREEALGRGVIVPGHPEKSRLIARIVEREEARRMPPPSFHKQLTNAQKELLKRWVAQGAKYEGHWAYLPPQRPAIPTLTDPRYDTRNPIDALVRARLKSKGLVPSPEADPRTLIRRLYFDLTGLPPSPEEVDRFVAECREDRVFRPSGVQVLGSASRPKPDLNTRAAQPRIPEYPGVRQNAKPSAYDRLVDRLLASPHYGERMALGWLDVVRYADTIGYHSDNPRNVWPYRDWVIRSFNENKPFDRFTLEQLAGDLLAKEYETKSGARVAANTLTTSDTRSPAHPLTHSSAPQSHPAAPPFDPREAVIGSAFNRLLLTTEEGGAQAKDYEARMLTDRVRAVGAVWLGQTTGCAQCHDHKFDPFTQKDFYSLGAFFADIQEPIIGGREPGMLVTTAEQEQELAKRDAAIEAAKAFLPRLQAAQAEWETAVAAQGFALPELAADSKAPEPEKKRAAQAVALLKKPAASRSPEERAVIEGYYRARVPHAFKAELDGLAAAERARNDYYQSLPKCIVSVSGKPRTVRILPRGNWMDESGEVVKAALPHYLPQPKIEGREPTRLDLAKWLVSRENPLTARTVMNRLWKQFCGTGLSKVLDDFGAQGEPPVNPALLDWLACEFMDSGWDMKHMVRTIVTSATYRQSSSASPKLLAVDPYNRELARQSAFRLDAELVRDNALAISGLLVPKIGGPSVKPYQPAGYWENLNFPTREWASDRGESQYRRGFYTWWQRSFLHPSLLAFDAPSREECAADRTRSNLPQQALVLLNDPTYVEAARVFAARILREGPSAPEARITWAWQQALQRDPRPAELRTMRELLDQQVPAYRSDPKSAAELLKVGFAPVPEGLDPAELAAWTHVARVLLNLHETITRP